MRLIVIVPLSAPLQVLFVTGVDAIDGGCALKRFVVNEYTTEEPFLQAKITLLEDKIHNDKKEFTAVVSTIKDLASNIIKKI